MNWLWGYTWPAALDAAQGGSPKGSFEVKLPSAAKEIAECERDFARTYVRGSVALVTPTSFCEKFEPGGDLSVVQSGDVSHEAVHCAVSDLADRLMDIIRGFVLDVDDYAPLQSTVASDVLLVSNLSIGPALDFSMRIGVSPRILQTKFVVLVAPHSIRVATYGYVGEPLLGDGPPDHTTPFLVRLLTQNLVDACKNPSATLRISYHVRAAEVAGQPVSERVAADVPILRQVAMCGETVLSDDGGLAPLPSLTVDVVVPCDGVVDRDGTTFFRVDVTPVEGGAPWSVERRYHDFRELYNVVTPWLGSEFTTTFPRKHLRACLGARLEARRSGLDAWLREVVMAARGAHPDWLRPLCRLLEAEEHLPPPDQVQHDETPSETAREDGTASPILTIDQFLDNSQRTAGENETDRTREDAVNEEAIKNNDEGEGISLSQGQHGEDRTACSENIEVVAGIACGQSKEGNSGVTCS